MGKKKNHRHDGDGEEAASAGNPAEFRDTPAAEPPPRKGLLPSLSVGDVLALLTLTVLSATLLLEGYHKEFRDYSKEIIALFAIVVGFLLGRKT